jgi:hypothetical protein
MDGVAAVTNDGLFQKFDTLEALSFGSEPFIAARTECRNTIDALGGS